LLRLRNFTLGKKISDMDVLSEDGLEKIADIIGAIVPWVSIPSLYFHRVLYSTDTDCQVTYLNSVVMPDPVNADDEEDSDSD
jgi:hypothetical protein